MEKSASVLSESLLRSLGVHSEVSLDTAFDVFLSYRTSDWMAAKRLHTRLTDRGFAVYLDAVVDPQLKPDAVTDETARILRTRMDCSESLLFVTTTQSGTSKWMPWELGYCDGARKRVAVFPALPRHEYKHRFRFSGQEYLGLYPWIDEHVSTEGTPELWANTSPTKYVEFRSWLCGSDPTERWATTSAS